MARPVLWAFSAAIAGTALAFGLSVYRFGVPASFPLFFLRSIAVIGLSLTLSIAIILRYAEQ